MTARKPTPVAQLHGNPGHRSLAPVTTVSGIAHDTVAKVPLRMRAHGKALWKKAQDQATWLSDLDLASLEDLCRTWDEISAMRDAIGKQGLTLIEPIVSPTGAVVGERIVNHPLLKELRAAEKHFAAQATELGLTPTGRGKLGIAEVQVQSALEELRRRRAHG